MSLKEKIKIEFSKYNNKTQYLRLLSLFIFSFLSVWIGIEFYYFINSINSYEFYPRPAGADAYLPISSLMNVRYFLSFGDVHMAHPAGFFIIIAAIFVSLIFSKSFCSWVCPFGFLSELLIFIRKIFINKNFKIHPYFDLFLRSLKYLLLGFFIYVIFFSMTPTDIKKFLDSDYNKISDVKMFYFFADISKTALIVITILLILSFLFNFFWCRYLCPYGALMAIVGFISPFKIKRNDKTCTQCKKCRLSCPHYIEVNKKTTVISDDCSSCVICINSCPEKNTLELRSIKGNKLNTFVIFFAVILIFALFKYTAIIINKWNNNLTHKDYKELILKKEVLSHPSSF